jgi:dTDP-4-dehydrorhamnose reductase
VKRLDQQQINQLRRTVLVNDNNRPSRRRDEHEPRMRYVILPPTTGTAAVSDVDYCEKTPAEAYRINSEGTRHLALAAREVGAIFCYVSTDYVFDGRGHTPYREEDRCAPVNVYGKSKLLGEEHARLLSERHWIVRTSWLFGEKRDSFVHHVLEWAKSKKDIRLVEDKIATPTYTADLASALYALFEKKVPWGIYHMTNEGGCSWMEYGKKILEFAKIRDVSVVPMRLQELDLLAKRPLYSILSGEKLLKAVGMGLRFWEGALEEYVTKLDEVISKG